MFDPGTVPAELRNGADAELARIEEAGLHAAQPSEQLLVDGWLLRFSPGKARRARSVNAIGPGRLDLPAKLEVCRHYYREARLPLLFRITPFSQPATLDAFLQRCGFEAFDQTRVMTCSLGAEARWQRAVKRSASCELHSAGIEQFAGIVGALRGSPPVQIDAHEQRLRASPLRASTVRLIARIGEQAVAAGQTVIEGEYAGLYDIVTAPSWRGRGLGRAISARLLADAQAGGARLAYLQVDAGNEPARHVYASLRFTDRYAYWYRREAGAIDRLLHQEEE